MTRDWACGACLWETDDLVKLRMHGVLADHIGIYETQYARLRRARRDEVAA